MSVIPDKDLFIVTSALHANIGVVNSNDRFGQTINTLKDLRLKCPNSIILFADGSPIEPEKEKLQEISKHVDIIILWTNDSDIREVAMAGRKSESEIIMLFKTLSTLKQNPDLMKMMNSVRRIYKYSARSLLDDNFDISKYENLFGKYVFKKAIPSWLPENKKKTVTDHLYITRFYSFCPSLIDNYMNTLFNILKNVVQHNIDTEHAHYLCVDKSFVVEFEKLNCSGIVAGTGNIENY